MNIRLPGRPRTVFGRLMLAVGTVVVAVLLLSMLILGDFVESSFKRQLAEVMVQDALGVSLWAAPLMAEEQVPVDVRPHLPWLHAMTEGRLWLVNGRGEVVADTGASGSFRGTVIRHAWLDRVLAGDTLQETQPDPWLKSAITIGQPIILEGKVVGAVFLFTAPTRLESSISQFRLLVTVTVLSAGVLGLFAAYILSRTFAEPIEVLARFAEQLGQKRFPVEMPQGGSEVAEFDRLAGALSGAAVELHSAFIALTEEKQRIAALIQDMAEGVVAVDERRNLLLVNPAAGQLLGLPGPFDQLPLAAVGFPTQLTEGLERSLADRAPDQVVVDFPCGSLEISARISPLVGETGQAFGAVAVLQDVTTELQLRRLRENFVANVSHELRGPLAALSAGVEAMHDGLISDEARPRYLRAMLAEMGRLRRLVDNLLELSRLDAGMLDIALEELDVRPLVQGLAEKWQPRTDAASIKLTVDCPAGLRVLANQDRVEEILTNFLDNAVRFTPACGTIRLFARAEGDMVRVGVADTGVGISREHLPHIWDRFYKADPARTRSGVAGTGLGLSIVRQLTQRLGGDVSVASEPGRGSTFSITLVAVRGK